MIPKSGFILFFLIKIKKTLYLWSFFGVIEKKIITNRG